MEEETNEMSLPDRSFVQAVAEAHERMTRELMEAVAAREDHLPGNTASDLTADIDDEPLRRTITEMLLVVKALSLFEQLKDTEQLNQEEYEELYGFVISVHQRATLNAEPWNSPPTEGSSMG